MYPSFVYSLHIKSCHLCDTTPLLQVLSRDIRALHKRLGLSKQEGLYHVILENVDVSYVMEDETVVLKGAILGGAGGRVQAELQSTTHTLGSVDIP